MTPHQWVFVLRCIHGTAHRCERCGTVKADDGTRLDLVDGDDYIFGYDGTNTPIVEDCDAVLAQNKAEAEAWAPQTVGIADDGEVAS